MATHVPENPAIFLTPVDREAHDWMTRFTGGNATAADLQAFRDWSARDPVHKEAFARACQLWEAIGPASDLLKSRQDAHVSRSNRLVGRRAFLGGALAASAAAAAYLAAQPPFGLWPSLSELAADYRTAPGEQRSLVLAGGPSVELNTRSSIALRPSSDGAERLELLGGEAAISTRAGMNVEVIAGEGRVVTADAVFNMRYERGIVSTTCVSGALDVACGDRSVRLRPGEQVVYSPNGLRAVAKVDPVAVTAWKDGMLVFQSTPLDEAVAEINRYRSGAIIITSAALGRRLFNARFHIANVDGVVAQIQQIFGASVTSLPGGIVLLG